MVKVMHGGRGRKREGKTGRKGENGGGEKRIWSKTELWGLTTLQDQGQEEKDLLGN